MECLNGIRVLSAIWVLYAHAHAMVVFGPIFNYAYIPVVRQMKYFNSEMISFFI